MKRFFSSMFIVLATLVILILVWELRVAVILFVLSLVVASAMRAPVLFWTNHGLPHALAVILTHLLVLLLLVGVLSIVLGPGLDELQLATDSFDQTYRQITANWPHGTSFQQMVGKQLPPPQDLYNAIAGEQGTQLLQNFLGVASNLMDSITKFAIILVLSIYWSFGRQNFEWQWISLLAADKRRRAREVWHELEESVGGYVRSEIFQSLIAGLVLGIGYSVMGLKFPVLIALTGALLWLIPWLGAGLAMVLPLLAGLSSGTALAIAAPLYTVVVLGFLELVVEPRLFTRRHYSSLLVVILMVAMAQAYGLIGLLLAPPLAAAIQTIFSSLTRPSSTVTQQGLAIQVNSLRERLAGMQEQLAVEDGDLPSPEVVNLLGRLSNLMEQANQFLEAAEKPEPT
jgi:predicted PurR-regulated permease PerM